MKVTCFGERHGNCKLTTVQVREIRASAEGARALGRKYGVNERTIDRIRDGDARRHET